MEKTRNGKTGRFINIKNPKSEQMRVTIEEKELILKRRNENPEEFKFDLNEIIRKYGNKRIPELRKLYKKYDINREFNRMSETQARLNELTRFLEFLGFEAKS